MIGFNSIGSSPIGGGSASQPTPPQVSNEVLAVIVTPSGAVVTGGVPFDFGALVIGTGNVDPTVTWATDIGEIDAAGTLLVIETNALQQITVTATSEQDPTVSGTAVVIVLAAEVVPPAMASRTVSIILGSGPTTAVVPAANLTGLSVSFHDEPTPGRTTVARYQSDAQTTDALGRMTFSFLSTLPVGGQGLLVVQSASGIHFNAPVAVS